MGLIVRDFIYLDIERLKSIIAQIEEGITEETTSATSRSTKVQGNIEGGLSAIIKAAGGTNFLWQKGVEETKTLHDFIYNKVEDKLLAQEMLVTVPGDLSTTQVETGEFQTVVQDTSFLLATGKASINHYENLATLLDNFEDLASFIAFSSASKLPKDIEKVKRNRFIQEQEKKLQLDKETTNGLQLILKMFYKNRVVIKLRPFDERPNFRLVGNLNTEFLRDDISSIIYKYSTAPIANWTIFGQVASIPPETRVQDQETSLGGSIEFAMESIFKASRQLELMMQSVVYPEIAITPIAIYRG